MAVRSKRKAREAALRALYEIEVGHAEIGAALEVTLEEASLSPDMAGYTERLVRGIRAGLKQIDGTIAPLVRDYDYTRTATVDRNVLRIATFELFHVPEIPPAVTINEAIEIARRYSTAESGKFVNGILGRLIEISPKANWDPATAPPEVEEPEPAEREPEIQEEIVQEGSEEAKTAARYGVWKIRTEEPPRSE